MEYRRYLIEKLEKIVGTRARNLESEKIEDMRKWEDQAVGVILVRHPLTRLYSSWSNRFYKAHAKHYPKKIKFIKENFENAEDSPPEGMTVTFVSFLKFITSTEMWADTTLQTVIGCRFRFYAMSAI